MSSPPIERSAWRTLAITSTVGFMVSLEITVIALALPDLRAAFPDASQGTVSWVITAYNIGVASLLLGSGWLADRHGRRRVFLIGIALFGIGSMAAGLAPSIELLIVARSVQSIGGALQFPSGLALLLAAFPVERHQMAIGTWGAMGGLAAAAGPSVGGLLVDAYNWRAVFLINVPIVVLISVVGPRWLTESRADGIPDSVDLISVPLAALGVGAFILAIVQGGDWGWTSAPIIGCLASGLALVGVFVVRSRSHPSPLFDLDLFKMKTYRLGNLGSVFFSMAFFGYWVLLPSFIQNTWGWSTLRTGFAIAPGPVVSTLVSPFLGRLADRIGNGPILTVGGISGVIGMALHLQFTGTEPSYVTGYLIPGLFVGLAAGCSFAMLVGASMRGVPPHRYGMAGAGRTTVFQLSVAVGIAMAVALIGSPSSPAAALDGVQRTWIAAGVLFGSQAVLFGFLFPPPERAPS